MDRYDRLELMILIEDAFTGVEFTDDDGDQIEVVGDLIRHIEGNERRSRKLIGLTRTNPYPSGEGPEPCQLAAADPFSRIASLNLVNETPFERALRPCRIFHFC